MTREEFEKLQAFGLGKEPVFFDVADSLREWAGHLAVAHKGVDVLTLIGDHAPASVRGFSTEDGEWFWFVEAREYSMDEVARVLHDAHPEMFEEEWNAEA